jgi:MYXO-CTERM domain-containing protein
VRRLAVTLAVTAVLPAATAYAHVEITPKRAPAGSGARLTLEVENERSASTTRKVDVQFPSGVTSVDGLALRGWKLSVRPSDGRPKRATLTAPRGKELSGDQAARFRLLVGLPARAAATLTFKVLQTYDNGEVVRWIGPSGAGEPAPTLRLTAPKEVPPTEAPATETQPRTEDTPLAENPAGQDDGGSNAGPIIAGVGAVLLLALAGAVLVRRRKG